MVRFLSGLPRSGSTLLAAILNQHPSLYVSSTSPLIDLMGAMAGAWEGNPSVKAQGRNLDGMVPLLRTVMKTYYADITKPCVVDKGRGWPDPTIMMTLGKVLGAPPKIVATVRNIPDCAASFVRVAKPDDVKGFLRSSELLSHLKKSYVTLKAGYESAPENFHIVDYDDLLDRPDETLASVLEFLELDPFKFDLNAIEGESVAEYDEIAWGIPGLHDVKPLFQRQHTEDSRTVLGDLYTTFLQPEFWKPNQEPPQPQILDQQRDANLHGDFEKGWELAKILELTSPTDDRAAFNRGFHLLQQGDLQAGMELLARGRNESVFGNPPPTGAPIWDGKTPQVVLLNLEGGLGDQIHGVRYAKEIANKGCEVIVAASPELCSLLRKVEGVTITCTHAAAPEVYHDSWIPAMSAPLVLKTTWNTIDGRPYITGKRAKVRRSLPRVGIRWRGNPTFEHEQHRTFPTSEFFAALQTDNCDFVSLQRDEGTDVCPDWVSQPRLNTWEDTAVVIGSCDLIISSCTSVAHLAGAMGVTTWIIVPIMPYYLWARPGTTTSWYESVRLYRQMEYDSWSAPFKAIKRDLKKMAK